MRTGTNHLFIPGPTNVPEAVRQAMNVPMQDMRAPDFGDLTLGLFTDLKRLFRTADGRVMMFPGSGTAAWEAAMTNTLSPGDTVLMSRFGQFSHLWVEMAERLGLNVICIDVAWGGGVPVSEYGRILGADTKGDIKAVFATHNETATGVTSDVAAVRRVMDDCSHDALLFVDGVSAIGSVDFRMDDWRVDLAVTGSQKGLMLPAGLGILAVSAKAIEAATTATSRRAYFEFKDMLTLNETGYFPYTPPTQLFHGLRKSLDRIFAEGLDEVIARHHRLAEGVRRIGKSSIRSRVNVNASPYFATRYLLDRVARFRAAVPEADLRLTTMVDLPDFVADDVDVAIQWGYGGWKGFEATLLLRDYKVICCTPELARQISGPQDLASMPLLHPVLATELWPHILRHLGVPSRGNPHDIRFQDAATMRRGTLAGLGIGLISTIDAAEDLKVGKLVAPFGMTIMQDMTEAEVPGFYLILPKAHRRMKSIAAFCAWIETENWATVTD